MLPKVSIQSKSHCCIEKTAYCLQPSNTFAASWYSKCSTAVFYNISSVINHLWFNTVNRHTLQQYMYSHDARCKMCISTEEESVYTTRFIARQHIALWHFNPVRDKWHWQCILVNQMSFLSPSQQCQSTWRKHKALTPTSGLASSFNHWPPDWSWKGRIIIILYSGSPTPVAHS